VTYNRYEEPGWEVVDVPDPSGRRGLWTRTTKTDEGLVTKFEVCAGREGDDYYVSLEAGQELDSLTLYELAEALSGYRWAVEMAKEEV